MRCQHRWRIAERPERGAYVGTCRVCGARRTFPLVPETSLHLTRGQFAARKAAQFLKEPV